VKPKTKKDSSRENQALGMTRLEGAFGIQQSAKAEPKPKANTRSFHMPGKPGMSQDDELNDLLIARLTLKAGRLAE